MDPVTIIVTDPCFNAAISLNSGVIPDESVVYIIGTVGLSYDFEFANMSNGGVVTACPDMTYSLVDGSSGAAIDPEIFTFDAATGLF